ncbi:MAG: CDP-alcohol phosphatidyltransferase family protein [Syntrophorhabdaceae bacterium]|nr:CDP-alcohol phosphatidyltransferase family protein [Syntrophorhabdaceae bacterium]
MNIPNLLSLLRLLLTVIFVVAVNRGRFDLALICFLLQAISDLLDGLLARLMRAKTYLGAVLDPMADKIMLASSYIVLSVHGIIPLWLTVIVIGRDFFIASGFLVLYKFSHKLRPRPSILSKFTTLFQMCTVVYVLWSEEREFSLPLFYITGVFSLSSGVHYMIRGIETVINRPRER